MGENANSISEIFSLVASFLSLVGVIFIISKNWAETRKLRSEAEKTRAETNKTSGADTTETYAKAAGLTAEQNIALRNRMDILDGKVDQLYSACLIKDKEITDLKHFLEDRDRRILDLESVVEDRTGRVSELEKLVQSYEKRIQELEVEVRCLKNGYGKAEG